MQALKTQINLARMAPAQLVVLIEKRAGECMTPCPSEERNWSQKGPALFTLVVKGQSILLTKSVRHCEQEGTLADLGASGLPPQIPQHDHSAARRPERTSHTE